MRTILLLALVPLAALLLSIEPETNHAQDRPAGQTRASTGGGDAAWSTLAVPGTWEARPDLAAYDGVAWYRCKFALPANWEGERIELRVERVDNAHEAFVNGQRVGGAGAFPPKFENGLESPQRHALDPSGLRFGGDNVVVLRVYDDGGAGGFKGPAPAIVGESKGIWLSGTWEFRTGDDETWAVARPEEIGDVALRSVQLPAFKFRELASTGDDVLPPSESIAAMTVADDLEVTCVLSEPTIRQPLAMHFDPRGRLWVVNYEQYPNPAGLVMLSRDKHWRAVYDKVPLPPPHGVKGRDRITIHEDTDGDGEFDATKVFVDDLNIASACAVGRGGVWVMNPPYLLFYPDADGDDVPDGNPAVHLEGFGLEDTHSVANSLTWGPDGWLYGAQGSTVSSHVKRPGDKTGVYSMGQNVWRYHPETKVYEIFAEGGGNAFGIEFDGEGRVFSGHNGGNTRGFHYVQGGYYRKGFDKHGPLSNAYAFGHIEQMQHHDVERFTHDFVIYDDTALPERYRGQLLGVEPLQGRIVRATIEDAGSTFRTKDVDRPISTTEKRFRPVAIEVGPDGAVYVADFHEPQISHREHFAGIVENTTGRIFRLQGRNAVSRPAADFAGKSSAELIELLRSAGETRRQLALRVLGERRDASIVEPLRNAIDADEGRFALECLWALHQTAGLGDDDVARWLRHPFPPVREWTVRLSCDDGDLASPLARQLVELAATEPDVRARSQLACSARRLAAEQCLPIVRALLSHDEDISDPHLPLVLWWAIESKCGSDPEAVVSLFEVDRDLWSQRLVGDAVLERLMRRFALAGSRRDLLVCARLFAAAPDDEATKRLMTGFEQAFRGRTLSGLPDELVAALAEAGGGSPSLRMRRGDRPAIDEALRRVADRGTKNEERVELIETLGEIREPRAVDVLLDLLDSTDDRAVRLAVLAALQPFDDVRIADTVVGLVPRTAAVENDAETGSNDEREAALNLLASRASWSHRLLEAVETGRIEASSVPIAVVRKTTLHRDEALAARVAALWPSVEGASGEELRVAVERYAALVDGGHGDPYGGKRLFEKSCGKCHLLFGEGGRIGPDLTPFRRNDDLNLLINVVNPSAEVREGFETWLAVTEEGRVVTGFLTDRDDRLVVLRTTDGHDVRLPTESIEELARQPKSLMPEGLLKDLTDGQVRDLFAYLRSGQPLNE